MVSNKKVIFAEYPAIAEIPTPSNPTEIPVAGRHIQVIEDSIDLDADLPEGDILLKTLEISIDPYMVSRFREPTVESYSPPLPLNETVTDDTVSVVLKSNNPNYKVGDIVYGRNAFGYMQEYVQVDASYAKEFYVVRNEPKDQGVSFAHYVGALGMSGMTAYYGLTQIGQPKKGETLFVSGATGNVGQLVGQFGKALGLYVVGTAGSAEKVKGLLENGFDAAFNYNDGDIEENLRKHCPNGIDVYFDVVGGKMLDAVFNVANQFARIVSCSMTSQDKLAVPETLYNIWNIVLKDIKLQGFIVFNYMNFEEQFLKEATPLFASGKAKYHMDIVSGIENVPAELVKAFHGSKNGKQVVHVADL